MSTPAQSQLVTLSDERGLRPTREELCQNTRLLIRLRWVAGLSILFGTVFARGVLAIDLKMAPLLTIGLGVLVYNSLLFGIARRDASTLEQMQLVNWSQILLDWLAMTVLVHFTGGITSPALIYFVIHVVLAGTIMLPRHARSLAVMVIGIIGGLAYLERTGWLPHVRIAELELGSDLYQNATYTVAVLFFFGTTVIALSELVTRISQRLRQREEHIRQLYEARSTFLRVATHELRAPLAAGLSLMHNIEQGYAGEFNEQQAVLLHRVSTRLEGLRALIDGLLDLAASQEASIAQAPLERVSARAILQRMIERETPNAERKGITLNVDLAAGAGEVMAGDIGLAMIFGNLLNNAIKYTPEGGEVFVTYAVNRLTQTVDITFTDTGIGIPADDLPLIFNEFFRAQNAKRAQINGTGIGLSTARTLIERYRGTITIQSEEGKGSTFTVSLPLAPLLRLT